MGSPLSFYSIEGHMVSLGPVVFLLLFSEKGKTLPPLYKKRNRKEKLPIIHHLEKTTNSILDYILPVIHYAGMYLLSIAA